MWGAVGTIKDKKNLEVSISNRTILLNVASLAYNRILYKYENRSDPKFVRVRDQLKLVIEFSMRFVITKLYL